MGHCTYTEHKTSKTTYRYGAHDWQLMFWDTGSQKELAAKFICDCGETKEVTMK